MRSLFAIPLAFCSLFSCLIWTIRTTNESRRFSLETDIRVWKNAARCFINNVSKNQTEKNDLRPIVLSKIINHLLFICFLNLFHSILFYFFLFSTIGWGWGDKLSRNNEPFMEETIVWKKKNKDTMGEQSTWQRGTLVTQPQRNRHSLIKDPVQDLFCYQAPSPSHHLPHFLRIKTRSLSISYPV